jgi:hypothetical protein
MELDTYTCMYLRVYIYKSVSVGRLSTVSFVKILVFEGCCIGFRWLLISRHWLLLVFQWLLWLSLVFFIGCHWFCCGYSLVSHSFSLVVISCSLVFFGLQSMKPDAQPLVFYCCHWFL